MWLSYNGPSRPSRWHIMVAHFMARPIMAQADKACGTLWQLIYIVHGKSQVIQPRWCHLGNTPMVVRTIRLATIQSPSDIGPSLNRRHIMAAHMFVAPSIISPSRLSSGHIMVAHMVRLIRQWPMPKQVAHYGGSYMWVPP